jgi:hypothetical protein
MGMDYAIGQAIFEPDLDRMTGEWTCCPEVQKASHPNYPMFPNCFTDSLASENRGGASYSGMAEFIKEAGLEYLFKGSSSPSYGTRLGLVQRHPGCVEITPYVIQAVANARFRRQLLDGRSPGYSKRIWNHTLRRFIETDGEQYDWVLARLIWLEGWMNWAIRNCDRPAFYNS